jgi:hypothetical protein
MPLRAPPVSPSASGSADEDISIATHNSQLPIPPDPDYSPKDAARVNRALAEYYWTRHFERKEVDIATFVDRLMTDYAFYEPDVVGDWLEDMSVVYKLYKVCLNYGASHGTPAKAAQAKLHQGVRSPTLRTKVDLERTLAREPGVQDVRNRHRQLRAARGIFATSVVTRPLESRISTAPRLTSPSRPVETPTTTVMRGARLGSPVIEARPPSVVSDSMRSPTPTRQSVSPSPRSPSSSSNVNLRRIQPETPTAPNIAVEGISPS